MKSLCRCVWGEIMFRHHYQGTATGNSVLICSYPWKILSQWSFVGHFKNHTSKWMQWSKFFYAVGRRNIFSVRTGAWQFKSLTSSVFSVFHCINRTYVKVMTPKLGNLKIGAAQIKYPNRFGYEWESASSVLNVNVTKCLRYFNKVRVNSVVSFHTLANGC